MDKFQLHKAALESDYELGLKLISLNVELNQLDLDGHTALHWAVFRGDVEFVKILLQAGANPNVFSTDGVTPKWRARDFGLVEIDELLQVFGGKILTNENFDRTSFLVFNNAIEQALPKDDLVNDKAGNSVKTKTWWRFW